VDYSARVQTVTENHSPMYYRMIKKFDEKYGCPVIINTRSMCAASRSSARRNTLISASWTNMDYLLSEFPAGKKDQKPLDKDINWLKEFELD
jgi:carbamoyltransferase